MKARACVAILAVLALAAAGAFLVSDQNSPYVAAVTEVDDTVDGDIIWSLRGGVLTVRPNVPNATMNDYYVPDPPWYIYSDEIIEVVIEYGITTIGDYAFSSLEHLTDVSISDTVASIGEGAFHRCLSLRSITIPDSVETIGESAFELSQLISITIPGSVETIGDYAFYNTHSLESVTISEGVETIGESAFENSQLISIIIPGSVETIGERAFFGLQSLESVVISEGVETICDEAFGFTSLTSIVIPASVIEIGYVAFYGCTSLVSVTVMGSDVDWDNGDELFDYCSSLSAISIYNPHALDSMPSGTLYESDAYPSPDMIVVYFNTAQPVYATQSSTGVVTLTGFSGIAVQVGDSAWDADVATVRTGGSFDRSGRDVVYVSLGVSHTVAASAANGTITPSGDVLVEEGGSVEFAFSANPGYAIQGVRIYDQDHLLVQYDPAAAVAGRYTFHDVTADGYAIAVETTRLEFSVTASADANSTITPAGSVGVSNGGSATFTFSANSGYAISDVVVDGASVPSAVAAGKYAFSGVTSNHTISVKSAPSASSPAGSGNSDGSGSGSGSGSDGANDGAGDSRAGDGDDEGVSVAVILAGVVIAIAAGSAVLWVVLGRR